MKPLKYTGAGLKLTDRELIKMLVIHMDSGLGNQMLDYVEYLAIQKSNPDRECYLENMIYDLPHKEGMFSMWNGYELERVFGIRLPNIKEHFRKDEWQRILKSVEESRFWEEDWNYSRYIVEAMSREGIKLNNMGEGSGHLDISIQERQSKFRRMLTDFFRTAPGYHIKRLLRLALMKRLVVKNQQKYDVYRRYPDNSFAGHSLAFKFKGFDIEQFDREIREAFRFPPVTDEKNKEMLSYIQSVNSVAIHDRRSDLLFVNGYCYKYGFFRRAVRHIKRKVPNPVFVFFTDENSTGWCEENQHIFGLDLKKDEVRFVTWNKGEESYRDMQLMAECKHNIFTESTFGFWGAYLNANPDKITCAPDCTLLATNTF